MWALPPRSEQGTHFGFERPPRQWHDNKLRQKYFGAHTIPRPFGIYHQLQRRKITSTSRKTKTSAKRVGKTDHPQTHVTPKDGRHFGGRKEFFDGYTQFAGLYRPASRLHPISPKIRLGLQRGNTYFSQRASERIARCTDELARKAFLSGPHPGLTLRCLKYWMGGHRCQHGRHCPRVLEKRKKSPHKCQGIVGSDFYCQKPCKTKRHCPPSCGQPSHFLVLDQARRAQIRIQRPIKTIFAVVRTACSHPASVLDSKRGRQGRLLEPSALRPRRLHSANGSVSNNIVQISRLGMPNSGLLCVTGERKISPLHFKDASLGSSDNRCIALPTSHIFGGVRKPSVDLNWSVARKVETKPKYSLPHRDPFVGWCTMVAPTSEAALSAQSSHCKPPLSGNVSELFRKVHAGAKMAPPLHLAIRQAFQAQKISHEDIMPFLKRHESTLHRYSSALVKLWFLCDLRGISPFEANLPQIAAQLAALHELSPADARNAYSALLLLPQFEQLRFSPLLTSLKRQWNHAQHRYSTFLVCGHSVAEIVAPTPTLEQCRGSAQQTHFGVETPGIVQEHRFVSHLPHHVYGG